MEIEADLSESTTIGQAIIDYPLTIDGVEFYAGTEDVLATHRTGYQLSFELTDGNTKPLAFSCKQHIVQRMRKATSKVDYVEALAH